MTEPQSFQGCGWGDGLPGDERWDISGPPWISALLGYLGKGGGGGQDPRNFIKWEKTSCVCARKRHALVLNSYLPPPPPTFPKSCIAPEYCQGLPGSVLCWDIQGRIQGGGGPGGPPNFIKRKKTLRVCSRKRRILVLNSYPDPPTFPKSCSAPGY